MFSMNSANSVTKMGHYKNGTLQKWDINKNGILTKMGH